MEHKIEQTQNKMGDNKIYTLIIVNTINSTCTFKNCSNMDNVNSYIEQMRNEMLQTDPNQFEWDLSIRYAIMERKLDDTSPWVPMWQDLYPRTWFPYMKWKAINCPLEIKNTIEKCENQLDELVRENNQIVYEMNKLKKMMENNYNKK